MFEKTKAKLDNTRVKLELSRRVLRYGSEPTVENEQLLLGTMESYVGRPYHDWTEQEQKLYQDMLDQAPSKKQQ